MFEKIFIEVLNKPKFYVLAAAVVILTVMIVELTTNPLDNSVWLTENEIVNTFEAHDLENVGEVISFEFNQGFSGTGVRLNDDGVANLGGSGGNGGGANPPNDFTLTVMWSGQEESLVLQIVSS